MNQEPMLNVRLLLPKQSTGACIGKGGVRMKEIRNECGAKIKIDDIVGGAPERLITIFGTVDAITHACQKMAEFIYNEFKVRKIKILKRQNDYYYRAKMTHKYSNFDIL